MNRFRLIRGAVLLAGCLIAAGISSAQTPANVVAWNGNGQLVCLGCLGSLSSSFGSMTVLVTDAAGNPVPGATVNWAVTGGGLGGQLLTQQTTTDANGMSSNAYIPFYFTGSQQLTYVQTTVTASTGSASTAFTLTQGLPNATNGKYTGGLVAYDVSQLLGQHPELGPAQILTNGTSISGQLGTTYSPPIKVRVLDLNGNALPNVAVNLYNLQPAASGPTVQCGGSNAINGTVLTDASGLAVCNPIFGGTPGSGRFNVMVGALESTAGDPTAVPQQNGFGWQLGLTVTPGAPASFTQVSGGGQSAQAGGALGSPLVVKVLSTNGAPLSGQTVTWSVSPAASASLSSTTSSTDSNGQASTRVTFATSASGTVTVTANLSGSSLPSVVFSETAVQPVTISGFTAASGNNQAAIVGAQFGSPLGVLVTTTSGLGANVPVQFSISGPATFSNGGTTATATTNATGVAQVNVTAGATPGAVTVTATVAGFSTPVTFNLTVSPPGPTLTAAGFINAADLQRSAIAPCSLGTVVATGVAPGVQNTVFGSTTIGPLPTTLAGDQVIVNGVAAPLVSVGIGATGQQQVTFQVPCETTPGSSVPVTVNVGAGSASINIPVQSAAPGVFTSILSDNNTHAVVVRPDGSFATIQNPARRGETVTAFVTGLGPSIPAIGTNALPPPGVIATPQYQVVVGMAGRGVPLITAQLSADRIGVWMVTFQIPQDVTPNNSVTFSISVIPSGASAPISSGTTSVPVQ